MMKSLNNFGSIKISIQYFMPHCLLLFVPTVVSKSFSAFLAKNDNALEALVKYIRWKLVLSILVHSYQESNDLNHCNNSHFNLNST